MDSMPVIIMGDSNLRNAYVKEIFEAKIKNETTFIQTNTKEALIIAIEKHIKTNNAMIFYCSWMNEITQKAKSKDDDNKDKEIAKVIDDIVENLYRTAFEKPDWRITVMKPIRRKMPVSIETRYAKISETIQESFYKNQPPNNLKLTGAPQIEDKQFVTDGVHLNREGYLVLQSHIIEEIIKAIQENEIMEAGMDLDFPLNAQKNTQINRTASNLPKGTQISVSQTPIRSSARQKRIREQDDSGDETEAEMDSAAKKNRQKEDRMSDILARMEALLEGANVKYEENTVRIEANTTLIEGNQQATIRALDDINLTIAKIKEDSDVHDNERSRDTVIIKKLVNETNVPTKTQDLTDFVKEFTKEMIRNCCPVIPDIKYVGLAYPIELVRMAKAPKDIPPIKIHFKNKEDALDFKAKAIEQSKKPNGKYSGAYLVHPQNPAMRIRVMIMWQIAEAIKEAKFEAWVAQSSTKPMLMIKKGQYPKSYGFVQAIQEHQNFLPKCDFTEANKLANRFFKGEAQRLFVVLNDDNPKGNILIWGRYLTQQLKNSQNKQ